MFQVYDTPTEDLQAMYMVFRVQSVVNIEKNDHQHQAPLSIHLR